MPAVYSPAEDSFLLSQVLEDYFENLSKEERKDIFFLDMGTGSGIQSEKAEEFLSKNNILAVDINPDAVKLVKNLGFNAIKSDLFSSPELKGKKFDIIAFNPPYLPKDEEGFDEGIDTTGGEKGDELPLAFLYAAKNYLSKDGVIFLLVSSITPRNKLEKAISDNYKKEIVGRKKLFFEELEVWKIS